MDKEDYFGDVAAPLNEEEEDAANDLTFGDLDDIIAGDDSDAAWNSDHQSLSSKIEAEKEALHRKHYLSDPSAPPSAPLNVKHQPSNHAYVQRSPQPPPAASPPTAWNLLQQALLQPPHQTAHQPAHQPTHQPTHQTLQQPMQSPPIQQTLEQRVPQSVPLHMQQPLHQPPQQPVRQAMHQHVHLQGHLNQPPLQHVQPHSQLSPQEYQYVLVSYQEQQTRLLLRQHEDTAEKQLREAERAQQAGIAFDKKQFDRHQEATRQMILSDHQMRIRQIQFQVFQYQQARQIVQQSPERPVEQLPALDLRLKANDASHLNGGAPQNSRETGPSGPSREYLPAEAPVSGGTSFDMLIAAAEREHREIQRKKLTNNSLPKFVQNEKLEKAPRMIEIERQMAEAGLGPASSVSARRKDAYLAPVTNVRNGVDGRGKESKRRLESMTDRDQELVFRAHLRQIETSVVYKDDYYNSILKKKEKLGGHDIFADLAERVQGLRLRAKQRASTGQPIRIRASKRATASSAAEEHYPGSSPPHSDQNMRALANALGTVQSWNPRAPRRVMDFGLLEKREPTEDGLPQKLLREDERVHVRQEVERGYDIIATIHDIARGENQRQTVGQCMQSLVSTLHLAERQDRHLGGQRDTHQSTRFFATMCVIQKGRRYLARVLELLDTSEKVRVMSAIFENLGMLVFAAQKAGEGKARDDVSEPDLLVVITKVIQDAELLPQDCLLMFDSFSASHVPHRDAFLTTFRSAVGSRLIFLCMQRISAGLSKQKVDEEDLSVAHIEQFSQAFAETLQDVFEGAESVNRVWEVTASLDALATGQSRTKYRAELNRLLRSGAVPPPPAA